MIVIIARGLALIITDGVPIFGLPPSFAGLGGGRLLQLIPVIEQRITLILNPCNQRNPCSR